MRSSGLLVVSTAPTSSTPSLNCKRSIPARRVVRAAALAPLLRKDRIATAFTGTYNCRYVPFAACFRDHRRFARVPFELWGEPRGARYRVRGRQAMPVLSFAALDLTGTRPWTRRSIACLPGRRLRLPELPLPWRDSAGCPVAVPCARHRDGVSSGGTSGNGLQSAGISARPFGAIPT
jgi:hypothetical protein